MTHSASVTMLRIVSILTLLTGSALVLALATPLVHGFNLFVDLAFLPLDSSQSLNSESGALMTAISGGMMSGFAVLVYQVTCHVFSKDAALGRRLLIPALLTWFILDGLGSLAAGAWFNVVMNTGFLLLFLLPLLLSRPQPETRRA